MKGNYAIIWLYATSVQAVENMQLEFHWEPTHAKHITLH